MRKGIDLPTANLLEAQALARRIPLFANAPDLRITELAGVISLNNTNLRVEAGDAAYLMRIGAKAAALLGIRRTEEIEAARAAALAGVGPEILYADPDGLMVMPFVDGRHWQPEEFHEPANIVRIAETLRRLHSVKTVAQVSQYRRIERLLDSATAMHLELPSNVAAYRRRLADIEQERLATPDYAGGLAHNDFWANNFLDDGERLLLVDWEFSGTGDTLIDLTTISMGSRYSESEEAALLDAYGLSPSTNLPALQTMKWVVSFFEAAWALAMHGIRGSHTGGFDYLSHASKMFDSLTP